MTQSSSPDPFEFLKSLWGSMGLPIGGMVVPILDIAELDKRIADLKSVENWLNMNLNVLKLTIQGLEMQRATLAAMQGSLEAGRKGAASRPGPSGNPFVDSWWSVLQPQVGKNPEAAKPKDSTKK